MIPLETGIPDLFLTTLKFHFNFIIGLFTGSKEKLSKVLAIYIINNKKLWFNEWFAIAESIGFQLNLNTTNYEEWQHILNDFLNKIHYHRMMKYEEQARQSESRVAYKILEYSLAENHYLRSVNIDMVSTIFKARGEQEL